MSAAGTPVELERRHASGVYATREVALVRGEGARLVDAEGRSYVDCASGHGVASLGHAHPRVAEAVAAQARRLVTCAGSWPNDVRAAYLARLSGLLPGRPRRIFLCNSGAESVEAAVKLARLATGRPGVVAAVRGFHGRTLGALSATWDRRHRGAFEPLVPGFRHAAYGRLEAWEEALSEDAACALVEVVQGEGGVHPGSAEFLRGLAELCRARGALLVVDEVQTGFGRTGKLFACEHHGLEPDLLCLGKAIAGGVPMGAVAIADRLPEIPAGAHGSTFGGNPLACAAACAVLDALEREGLVLRAAELGAWLLGRLRAVRSPRVRDVRGLGLLAGVELDGKAAPVVDAMLARGVIALSAGPRVVRFLPPLVIEREDLARAADAFEAALEETA